jgi:type VI secretion system protein ImpL
MNPNLPSLPPPSPPTFPKVAALLAVGLAIVATVIWAVNTFVGGDQAKIIITIILVFLAVLLVLWLIIWLIRKLFSALSSAKARRQEAQASAPHLGVTSEEQAELDALQNRLTTAVRVIRESKLSKGRKPDEALYTLPWIMMLGPTESGKTSALRDSGVDFPFTTIETRKSMRGGAVSACEYWFSRGAVVLDSTGRLGTDREMQEVFRGFIDQIKRVRRARPIDAVVITISAEDLLTKPAGGIEDMAITLRQRCDEMVRRLGIRFPVYLLFTKCDHIQGFQDFFANMRSRDRAQVWGATISRAMRKQQGAEQIFDQEFDKLGRALSETRLQLLAAEKESARQARIYSFPTYFAGIKEKFAAFIGTFFQSTPYSEKPLFRGFYLTSAASGPEAAAQVVQEGQQFWEPGKRLGAQQELPRMAKSFFLEELFPKVIFADRPLAQASVDTRLRRRLWLDVTLAVVVVLSIVLLVGMIVSFNENLKLIGSTRISALQLLDAGWDGKRTTDLMGLESFRGKVEELDRYSTNGPRWALRWGLYSGDQISGPARRVYFRRVKQSFVNPVADYIRKKLYAYAGGTETAASYDEFYTLLKAYMMMTEPPRAEESFLNNALGPIWKKYGPADAEEVSLKQLRFYAQQLPKNDPELQLDRDTEVVRRAQNTLSQAPALTRIYTNLKNEGNTKFQPYTLALATGGKSLDFLNSSHDVPGIFTEGGWSQFFKNAAAQASQTVVKEDWVLGPYAQSAKGQVSDSDYQTKLLNNYFAEYASEWQKFLEGISVRPLSNLTEARNALDSFSQPDSAISRLLMNVAANTMLRKEPEKGSSVSGMVSNALATLGLATRVNRAELVDLVANEFQPLHELVTSPDGKSPSVSAQYIEQIGKVHSKLESLFGAGMQWDQVKGYVAIIAQGVSGDEFHNSYSLIARVKQTCRTNGTSSIAPMLEQPLRQTWAAILRDVGSALDGLWRTRIAEAFRRDIGSKYPFNPSGQDLPISAMSQYMKPGDGLLWTFYDSDLKMFLSPAENRFAPMQLLGAQVNFSPQFTNFLTKAWSIRQAFWSGSSEPSVTFDLTPDPTPGVTESLLEIDGQRLLYRNTPSLPSPFSWPGKAGSPMARITIGVTGSGERPAIPTIDGEWAFFRLLAKARVIGQGGQMTTTFTPIWSLSGSDGRKFDLHYKLQARNVQNPFAQDFFSGIECPDRVTTPAAVAGLGR